MAEYKKTMDSQWKYKIFNVKPFGFEALALELFRFQYENNIVYHDYVNALQVIPSSVQSLTQIPFLPIRFFKTHTVRTISFEPEAVFESSGTSGTINSRHFIRNIELYKESFMQCFEMFYGSPKEWCIVGLLPSYPERKTSSLVFMVNELIRESGNSNSGFYLHEFDKLSDLLSASEEKKRKTLLIGVTFSLLDFAEKYPMPLAHTIIMETGGMKGRRKEMVREEVHDILKRSFQLPVIHSEYGMTELLSQAYSRGNGLFECPPWMKVMIRDDEDPLAVQSGVGRSEFRVRNSKFGNALPTPDSQLPTLTGAINIIDLANVYSCSFLATDDAGRLYSNGSFEVLGRMDNTDLRGCSLMVM